MRLIDADVLPITPVDITDLPKDGTALIVYSKENVDNAPTVDAAPIRHGHWIMLHKTHNTDGDNDYDWRCSECNHVDCHNINVEVPYCWYCGAKMDEVEKDEIN